MPRKKRIARQRLGYHSGHIFQFCTCTGNDYFGDSFGNENNISAMRRAWPILRNQVLELWAKKERTGPPFGCRFDKKTNAQKIGN